MEIPAQNNSYVELHVDDFKKAREYYGKLGFKIIWEREPEESKGYLVMKLEENTLCFWAGNNNVYHHEYFGKLPKETFRGNGVEIVLMLDNVENFYKKVKNYVNVYEKLNQKPWGLKDFRTVDPFGYYLRFTNKHNIHLSKYAVK